jgi:cytochrome P450
MTATVTIDFSDPAIRADPHPTYARLRAEAPIFWNGNAWLISRYDDIVTLLNHPAMSSARTDAHYATLPPEVREELQPLHYVLSNRMLLSDPPKHTRLKNLVTPAFSARMTTTRRASMQAIVDRFTAECLAAGEIDFMHDFATPVPSWVIADILGVPQSDQPMFTRWSEDQVRVYDRPGTLHDRVEVMRQGQRSMLEMRDYLVEIIDARRRDPQDDLITGLVQAEQEGDRLTRDELVVMIVAILIGGNNSTAHLIGNAMLTLRRHPDALERLRAEPVLIRPAIEEVLRFESPVQATSRVAKDDVEIGGQKIRAGDNVSVLIGSANRDPAAFDEPDHFVVDRHPNRHLTFAHGPHFCLGTSTARALSQTAVLTFVQRCRRIEPRGEPTLIDGFSFRGPKTMPLTVSAG